MHAIGPKLKDKATKTINCKAVSKWANISSSCNGESVLICALANSVTNQT